MQKACSSFEELHAFFQSSNHLAGGNNPGKKEDEKYQANGHE